MKTALRTTQSHVPIAKSEYVWLIENGKPVSYLGVPLVTNFTKKWFIYKTVKSKVARVASWDQVFLSKQLAIKSLVKFVCWYIEGDRIISACGHRRADNTIVVFDKKSEREIRYVSPFTTELKAKRALVKGLKKECKALERRIRRIDRILHPLRKRVSRPR